VLELSIVVVAVAFTLVCGIVRDVETKI